MTSDCLCLGKVHLACKECAAGEFARFRHLRTGGDEKVEDAAHNIRGSVAGYLHAVFARIGSGGTEDAQNHLVHNLFAGNDGAEAHRITA